MRILLLSSACNSMTRRVHVELAGRGHEVWVELALADEVMREAVRRRDPDLIVAPMLTTAIRADIWSARQEHRRIDWRDEPTTSVLAKLRAADSRPGSSM